MQVLVHQEEADPPAAASFSLTVSLLAWIESESKRLGVKKSVLVREILDGARTEAIKQEAQVA